MSVPPVRPPLKWAGGKRQLLPQIRRFYPLDFGAYLEPFVGSGAVFFDLYNQGLLRQRRAVLLDTNTDLVGCYLAIRDDLHGVIDALEQLTAGHRANASTHYYDVRDRRFNPARLAIHNDRGPDETRYSASVAAMLIYLNRTGFNGLFRLNSDGRFNVPIGRYQNPRICDPDNLKAVATALRDNVTLETAPFESVLERAVEGDFVYLDPPYAPLSPTAQFTSYTATRFSTEDQERVRQVVIALAKRRCWVLLSNSTAPEIRRLYDDNAEARAAGLQAHKVPARRVINSDPAKRGDVQEYLITNICRQSE